MLATMSLAAGPAWAQATDAMAAPVDIGRVALAFSVLSAIALLKIWSYADKRGKLMDRLTDYLASRAAQRSRHASASAQPHNDTAKAGNPASPQQLQESTGTQPTIARSRMAVCRDTRLASGFRILPVPGLPSHQQYLTD
jgi:hypothetical protein